MHLRGVLLCFEMMFVSVGLLIPFFFLAKVIFSH